MDVFGITDRGRVREKNEDQFLIADVNKAMEVHQTSLDIDPDSPIHGTSQGKLFVVADGIGGNAAGEEASRLAIECLAAYMLNGMRWLENGGLSSREHFVESFLAAIDHTNSEVREYASTHPDHRDMGTTLTVAYVKWPWLYVIHVGDSRCYLLNGTDLKQLTTDHTVAEMLAERSPGPGQEVRNSRLEHVLTNAIGGGELDTSPEILSIELVTNQLLLLCTDGLTKHLSDNEITAILCEDISAEATCRRLIEEANSAGGRDNITAIIADFQDAPKHSAVDLVGTVPSTM